MLLWCVRWECRGGRGRNLRAGEEVSWFIGGECGGRSTGMKRLSLSTAFVCGAILDEGVELHDDTTNDFKRF